MNSRKGNESGYPSSFIRSRGRRGLQSFPSVESRRLMGLPPPRSPWGFPGPSGLQPSGPPGADTMSFTRLLLSCPSTPPQRLSLPLAASLPTSLADPKPPSKSTSRRLLHPSAFPDPVALLSTTPLEAASDRPVLTHRKSRPQGLATLSTASADETLGGLFQPPTLLGFSLQSLAPLR
jgi:hypothetical protein